MPTQTLDPTFQELLRGRYIAALGTENADGTIHLTAVWYLEDGPFIHRDLFQKSESSQCCGAGKGLTDGGRAKTGSRARRQPGRES